MFLSVSESDSYSSLMVSVVFLYLLAYGNGAVNDSNCSGDVSHNKKGVR